MLRGSQKRGGSKKENFHFDENKTRKLFRESRDFTGQGRRKGKVYSLKKSIGAELSREGIY